MVQVQPNENAALSFVNPPRGSVGIVQVQPRKQWSWRSDLNNHHATTDWTPMFRLDLNLSPSSRRGDS